MGEFLLGCLGWNYPDTPDKGGWLPNGRQNTPKELKERKEE